MAEAVFRCFFPGRVRLFGKTNGHSRESLATNAAGKNDLLRGQNKVERNCRHAQGTQQIKSRSCRTVFLCGSFCFSVLICTPNTGCPVLGVHIKKASADFHRVLFKQNGFFSCFRFLNYYFSFFYLFYAKPRKRYRICFPPQSSIIIKIAIR